MSLSRKQDRPSAPKRMRTVSQLLPSPPAQLSNVQSPRAQAAQSLAEASDLCFAEPNDSISPWSRSISGLPEDAN